MSADHDEMRLTKLESIFVFGIIGCLLFATWELAHLLETEWLSGWVHASPFVRKRVIYYGIAFSMSVLSVLVTGRWAFRFGRFGSTVNRAFLWYGTLLLLSTIAIFVFDCLPEVFAGFAGAGIFILAIYVLQKRFFTKDRVLRSRLEKGSCFSCGAAVQRDSSFCSSCGTRVGKPCGGCGVLVRLSDHFCRNCGARQESGASSGGPM